MRKIALMAAAATTLALAAPAYAAECDDELRALNEKISSTDSNYRVVVGSGLGDDVRQLRDAARIFARNGQDDACEDVVEGIESLLDERTEELAKSENAVNRETWYEAEAERLQAAVPVTEAERPLRASDVIGADVRNLKNEDLGEIEDLVVSQQKGGNQAQYAILARGGFLGLGEKQVAVPWDQLKMVPRGDRGDVVFVLNVNEETLEEAPSFDRGSWGEIGADEEWRKQNDEFYRNQIVTMERSGEQKMQEQETEKQKTQ